VGTPGVVRGSRQTADGRRFGGGAAGLAPAGGSVGPADRSSDVEPPGTALGGADGGADAVRDSGAAPRSSEVDPDGGPGAVAGVGWPPRSSEVEPAAGRTGGLGGAFGPDRSSEVSPDGGAIRGGGDGGGADGAWAAAGCGVRRRAVERPTTKSARDEVEAGPEAADRGPALDPVVTFDRCRSQVRSVLAGARSGARGSTLTAIRRPGSGRSQRHSVILCDAGDPVVVALSDHLELPPSAVP